MEITGKTEPSGGIHQKYLGLNTEKGWMNTYEESGNSSVVGLSLVQTRDGGYAITGYKTKYTEPGTRADRDVYLVKTDSWGNIQWIRTYGEETTWEWGNSLVQTSDGGYAITGCAGGKVYLLKTDSKGVKQWDRRFGGRVWEEGNAVVQTSDGGYAVVGETMSFGDVSQVYVVKTNSAGDFQWHGVFGGSGRSIGYSLVQTSDGGYAIAGEHSNNVYLLKIGSTGRVIWGRAYGGTGRDVGFSLVQTSDGGYAIAGFTDSYGVITDVYLIKTNSEGSEQWDATYGGEDIDVGRSVVQTSDGGYAITGVADLNLDTQHGDVYLIKTDSEGNELWSKTYRARWREGWGFSVVRTSDGGYAIAGIAIMDKTKIMLLKTDIEVGLARTSTNTESITLYRGKTDPHWNYVRVRMWK